ncbi:MAG: hypothetical protein JO126_08700 [Alphaproteobacteria bacterium]|nr:hypothetical protein [Alphaproteobacteria bacterium]MBV8549521.1 hypothetical protein [Alphaproteobacteria bacterium]
MSCRRFYLLLAIIIGSLCLPALVLAAEEEGGGKKQATSGEGGGESGAKKKGGDEDVSGGRFKGDPVYVHLAPIVLPVIADSGVEQLVTVQIDVEVKDFDVADNIHTNMPKVRDSLMRALYGGLGNGSLRNGKLVDVTRIKSKALTALNDAIGSGVLDVLIQNVAQRML